MSGLGTSAEGLVRADGVEGGEAVEEDDGYLHRRPFAGSAGGDFGW
jgi:hypothetical protein